MTTPQEKRLGVGLFIEEYLEKIIHGGQIWYNRDAFLKLINKYTRPYLQVYLHGVGPVAHSAVMTCQPHSSGIIEMLQMMYRDDDGEVFIRLPDGYPKDRYWDLQEHFKVKSPVFRLTVEGYPAYHFRNGQLVPVQSQVYHVLDHANLMVVSPYPASPSATRSSTKEKIYQAKRFALSLETSDLTEGFAKLLTDRFASELMKVIKDGRAWERTY